MVEAVGVRGVAVRAVVVRHDGARVAAVQPFLLALLDAALPLLAVRAPAVRPVPVEHGQHHQARDQQGQQADEDDGQRRVAGLG